MMSTSPDDAQPPYLSLCGISHNPGQMPCPVDLVAPDQLPVGSGCGGTFWHGSGDGNDNQPDQQKPTCPIAKTHARILLALGQRRILVRRETFDRIRGPLPDDQRTAIPRT